MNRRGFLGLLGLAPIASVVAYAAKTVNPVKAVPVEPVIPIDPRYINWTNEINREFVRENLFQPYSAEQIEKDFERAWNKHLLKG